MTRKVVEASKNLATKVDEKTKKLKGRRSALIALLIAATGPALLYFEDLKRQLSECGVDPDTTQEICALPWWTSLVVGALVFMLRAITTTPLFNKGD